MSRPNTHLLSGICFVGAALIFAFFAMNQRALYGVAWGVPFVFLVAAIFQFLAFAKKRYSRFTGP